jgi:hypothetical protein
MESAVPDTIEVEELLPLLMTELTVKAREGSTGLAIHSFYSKRTKGASEWASRGHPYPAVHQHIYGAVH